MGSGLSYYGSRHYDAEKGRWPNKDPIGERGGKNLYVFVGNAAVWSADWVGLSPWYRTSDFFDFQVSGTAQWPANTYTVRFRVHVKLAVRQGEKNLDLTVQLGRSIQTAQAAIWLAMSRGYRNGRYSSSDSIDGTWGFANLAMLADPDLPQANPAPGTGAGFMQALFLCDRPGTINPETVGWSDAVPTASGEWKSKTSDWIPREWSPPQGWVDVPVPTDANATDQNWFRREMQ